MSSSSTSGRVLAIASRAALAEAASSTTRTPSISASMRRNRARASGSSSTMTTFNVRFSMGEMFLPRHRHARDRHALAEVRVDLGALTVVLVVAVVEHVADVERVETLDVEHAHAARRQPAARRQREQLGRPQVEALIE